MSDAVLLSDLFKVSKRFSRSINIVADYSDPVALDAYTFTPLGQELLARIAEGMRSGSRSRAWSITGPYGSGKSSFALYLSHVLGYPVDHKARERLHLTLPALYDELLKYLPGLADSGFLVVPVVGSREPLAPAILRALDRVLQANESSLGALDQLVDARQELRALINSASDSSPISVPEACQVIGRVAASIAYSGQYPMGLFLLLDEAGKFLEYAALNPARSDIYLLQSLAELAGCSGDIPIGLVVILHQAFEQYAVPLSQAQRREWSKIQGRFHDLGFLEAPAQLLKLVGGAVKSQSLPENLARSIAGEAKKALELGIAQADLGWDDLYSPLVSCAPLHPTVSLLLVRLFRSSLAQNERSLLAFLSSDEPYGLQDFLRTETWSDGASPFYRLDRLYDYIYAAMGSQLLALNHGQGARWSEVATTLDRLPEEANGLDARIVKIIGLLGLLGDQRNLKASQEVLTFALSGEPGITTANVAASLSRLSQWRLAIYRRYKGAYALWQGSDVDLDERFRQGYQELDHSVSLSSLLQRHGDLKPQVAKRHLYETGTLRYFATWVVDLPDLAHVLDRPFDPADGAVVYVIPEPGADLEQSLDNIRRASAALPSPRRELLLFALLQDITGLREALEEVAAWDWVAANTPELDSDAVARRELGARQSEALARLSVCRSRSFDKVYSYASARWVHAGEEKRFDRPSALTAALSSACDAAYASAPLLRNELINRRILSSAGAAARRSLLERMLTEPGKERLGIAGYPPELSIYLSVLAESGIHKPWDTHHKFGPPTKDSDRCRVRPLWEAMDRFFDSTETARRPISELMDQLRHPPFGLKDGVIPIYVVAALLCWEPGTALFERGTFIPKMDITHVERMLKAPELFTAQRYRLGDVGVEMFQRYAAILGDGDGAPPSAEVSLLDAVRPLIAFVKSLPSYARNTGSISAAAIAVREAVLRASEPHRLLLEDLPQALGDQPLAVRTDSARQRVFFERLRQALLELYRAYDELLRKLEQQLVEAMRASYVQGARSELARRADGLRDAVSDPALKPFILRLADTELSDRAWLESVAAWLAAKPPAQWSDCDLLTYNLTLAKVASQFRRVEDVLSVATAGGSGRVLRLGVTSASGEEQRDVISILPSEESTVTATVERLYEALQSARLSQRVLVAAIAELARKVMQEAEQPLPRQAS